MADPRQRAVSDLSTDLAVVAGAGSGKTSALVERFVTIAGRPDLAPERVLALTFTETAAAEMKERIVRRFEAAGDDQRRRETEAAYISTVHGFAARLLKENPFEAGVDPAFIVLADFDQQLLAEEALQAMFADRELGSYAERLGKQFEGGWRIFELVREVSRELREGPAAARREADLVLAGRDDDVVREALARIQDWMAGLQRDALSSLRELEPLLADAGFKSSGKKLAAKNTYLAAARDAIGTGDFDAGEPVWTDTAFTSEIPVDERPPIRERLDVVREIAKEIRAVDLAREEALEREVLALNRAIYRAAAASSQSYQDAKRALGALDYHDLQRLAEALLERDARVRERYAARFRHILLDEAQDTDELQHALIDRLRTPENRAFLVGDPKQAIYEFRGANPRVFEEALSRLPSDDRLRFDENFRSRREILGFINRFGDELLPRLFAPLIPKADYSAVPFDGPHVEVIHAVREALPIEPGDKQVRQAYEPFADARRREAAALAERVGGLLREHPLVRDPERPWESIPVPLRPRHIALLFRTRTTIPYFERAFAERGIPYVTAVGQEFYERTEVLDCLMMLRALEQPLDDLALAAVLKSPFVGASDGNLLRLRSLEREARPRGAVSAQPLYGFLHRMESLAAFRATFEALRGRTWGQPAAEALEDALRTFGYEAAIGSHPDGRAMLANVAKLRRQVADLGAATVGEALRELEKARALLIEERQAPLLGPADDVVVFTTIHQAKGLEWPVVCLPNLQGKVSARKPAFSTRDGLLLLDAVEGGEKVARQSVKKVRDDLKARADEEERRLLYVATTRARERLILTSSVKEDVFTGEPKQGFDSYFAFLAGVLGQDFLLEGECAIGGAKVVVHCVRGPVVPADRKAGDLPLFERVPLVAGEVVPGAGPASAPPHSTKVTELLAYARCPLVYRYAVALDIPEHPPRRAALRRGEREISAVEKGTIVHRLLERADLSADPAAEARRLAQSEEASIRGDLERMLGGVLTGEVGDLVRRANRVERELPFGMLLDEVEISGVIDLAVQGADGAWTVLDYKSNDISRTGRLEHLVEYYRPQLELYALAMERAGLGDVSHCALVFLNGPEVRRWPFADAEAARAEGVARSLLRGVAAEDYATEPGAKCAECGYRKRGICSVGRRWRG